MPLVRHTARCLTRNVVLCRASYSELNRILQEPTTREILSREGADPMPASPDEFTKTIAADVVKWAKVVKAAGLKVE